MVGMVATAVVIIVAGSTVARVKVPSNPDVELDYRQSRFYRKD